VLLAPSFLGGIADRVGIEAALGVIVPLLVVAALLAWLSARAGLDRPVLGRLGRRAQ
jgi:hypothetical protein